MHRRDLSRALFASLAGSTTLSGPSQAAVGRAPEYAQTTAEQVASVNPASPQYVSLDARRYGFSQANTGSSNATACRQAIAVAKVYGGTVLLPEGVYNVGGTSDVIDIPEHVVVRGAGMRATMLNNAGDGKGGGLFRLGGATTGVLKYGCQLSDLGIVLSNNGGTAIQLVETAAAKLSNIYIEGPIAAHRRTTGVFIDGGNASSFFNVLSQILCNHVHVGFDIMTSGNTIATQTLFNECTVSGDAATDSSSVGLNVRKDCGNGTVWAAGDMEDCAIAFHGASGCGSMTIVGARVEANKVDVLLDSHAGVWNFIGCFNLLQSKIIDNSGAGRDGTNFVGCTDSSGNPFGGKFVGSNTLRALSSTDVPARIVGSASQTNAILSVENNAGSPFLQVAPDGRLAFFGAALHGKPTCSGSRSDGAALESLLAALASLGLITDRTSS